MDVSVMERRRRRQTERPYRQCSSARLLSLRSDAVRRGDEAMVRAVDTELPLARADEQDDSMVMESAMALFGL